MSRKKKNLEIPTIKPIISTPYLHSLHHPLLLILYQLSPKEEEEEYREREKKKKEKFGKKKREG